jgi:hypothetical protein
MNRPRQPKLDEQQTDGCSLKAICLFFADAEVTSLNASGLMASVFAFYRSASSAADLSGRRRAADRFI